MSMIDLLRKSGYEPRFHGNGFIQLYLTPKSRLHIWTPEIEPIRDHNAAIHTHRYDMTSEVLHGQLLHRTIDIEECALKEQTCRVVQLTGASELRKKPGKIERVHYRHSIRHEYLFPAGSGYNFRAGLFHDSANGYDGVTATIMTKGRETTEFAKILLIGRTDQPTHAFDPKYQPEQELMWEIIAPVAGVHRKEIVEAINRSATRPNIMLDRHGKVC